ncbi:MAG TPA: hypothetical protein VM889_10360 [Candidatus Thermoplasmatota archaeon]|nr:hypothetical protein [Candidatus Thermoplasmatota archaeon]
MKPARWLAALAAGGLLAASLAAVAAELIEATRAESAPEAWLGREGFAPRRALSGPAAALAWGEIEPGLVVILGQLPLLAADEAALLDFAKRGGDVWVFSHAPRAMLPSIAPETLEGPLHGWDGGDVEVRYGSTVLRLPGLLAFDVDRRDMTIVTSEDTFRDTNLNGRLDVGEPAGAFGVGLARSHGDGRVVFIASADPERAFGELASPLARALEARGPSILLEGDATTLRETAPRVTLASAALPSQDLAAAILVVILAGGLVLASLRTDPEAMAALHDETLDGIAEAMKRRNDDRIRVWIDRLEEARR